MYPFPGLGQQREKQEASAFLCHQLACTDTSHVHAYLDTFPFRHHTLECVHSTKPSAVGAPLRLLAKARARGMGSCVGTSWGSSGVEAQLSLTRRRLQQRGSLWRLHRGCGAPGQVSELGPSGWQWARLLPTSTPAPIKHVVPHVSSGCCLPAVVCATRWVRPHHYFCFLENGDIRIRAGTRRTDRG